MKTWVKLYIGTNHDPDVGELTWAQRGLLCALWALAGEIDARDDEGLETGALDTLHRTAWRLRCEEEDLRELMRVWGGGTKLIERDGVLVLADYAHEQQRPPSDMPAAVRDRVRRHRAAAHEESEATTAPAKPPVTADSAGGPAVKRPVTDGNAVTRDVKRPVTAPESESDTETESESEAETHTRAPGARGGAGAPREWDPPSGNDDEAILAPLRSEFRRLTGISPPPRPQTSTQARAVRAKWDDPLLRIARAADGDLRGAQALLAKAVEQLRAKQCLVTSPRSVADTAIALRGQVLWRQEARRRDLELIERMAEAARAMRQERQTLNVKRQT